MGLPCRAAAALNIEAEAALIHVEPATGEASLLEPPMLANLQLQSKGPFEDSGQQAAAPPATAGRAQRGGHRQQKAVASNAPLSDGSLAPLEAPLLDTPPHSPAGPAPVLQASNAASTSTQTWAGQLGPTTCSHTCGNTGLPGCSHRHGSCGSGSSVSTPQRAAGLGGPLLAGWRFIWGSSFYCRLMLVWAIVSMMWEGAQAWL